MPRSLVFQSKVLLCAALAILCSSRAVRAEVGDQESHRPHANMFSGRMVPIHRARAQGNANETQALENAFALWKANRRDFRPLKRFLEDFPTSPWNASLHLNLGLRQYRDGFILRAL